MGRKQRIIIIVILFLVSICTYFLLKGTPNLLQYNAEKYIVYTTNDEEPLIESIVNPSAVKENKVAGVFMENQPYIGYFDLEAQENITVMEMHELSEAMGEKIEAEDVQNIQYISLDPVVFSFIVGNKLYKYDEEAGSSFLWEFTGKMSAKPYCWLCDKCVMLLDDSEIINVWKLFMVNTETGQKSLIDSSVSAFAVDEEIVYAKKYYMGYWCEWELHFLDRDFQNTREPVRSEFWSVGDIVFGADGEIYFSSDISGTFEKEADIYHFNGGIFSVRKVSESKRGDVLIGSCD